MRRRIPARLAVGLALVWAWPVAAQDYVLRLADGEGPLGGPATVSVLLDSSGGDDLQGWSWGVCHDSTLAAVTEVSDGATTATVADGSPPDFNTVTLLPGGWTIGVVISFLGCCILPPGTDYELNVATYQLLGAVEHGPTPLTFCDTLGSPPVATVVVSSGQSIQPTTLPGSLSITIEEEFRRGDCNDDDLVDIADGIWLLAELFQDGPASECPPSCDANLDGLKDSSDAIYIFNYFLLDGPPPPAPFPNCGPKEPEDMEECEEQDSCP